MRRVTSKILTGMVASGCGSVYAMLKVYNLSVRGLFPSMRGDRPKSAASLDFFGKGCTAAGATSGSSTRFRFLFYRR